jgi:hypothetical protein
MRKQAWCALAAALLLPAAPAQAQQGDGCSHDTLTVEGTALDVTLCPSERLRRGETGTISILESFVANGKTVSHSVSLDVAGPGEASRTIDDVVLQPLGIERTLHMTIRYRAGGAHLEHAMLIPGAITLK